MTQSFYTINGRTMTGDQVVMLALMEQERAEAAEARAAQLQAERDALAAELATVKAERDATQKCTLEKHYDKLGYPYIDGSCGVRYMPDEIDYREFVYCPFCGNEIEAAK